MLLHINIKKYWFVLIISSILFLIPFFWLKPGVMDLGGDSNRLYFYDPISFIKHVSLYNVLTVGRGIVEPSYYYLPFVGCIAILKFIGLSSTQVINLMNAFKLFGAFLSIFLITRILLLGDERHENQKIIPSSIMSGIFYIISYNSSQMSSLWDRAILSHSQVFLNPLIFYLLLKFFLTLSYKYLWVLLILSFIFSPNFGLTSVPAFFAFYPLSILFLFIYITMIRKKTIALRETIIGVIFFLILHAFHLLSQLTNLIDKSSYINNRVFNKELIENGGVNYFSAIHGLAKIIYNIFVPSVNRNLQWVSFISPFITIVGVVLSGKRKDLLLIASFFAFTLFLVSANITNIGYDFYRSLFYIPGFSIFRNFYTQWLFIFIFYYSLLFGYGIFFIMKKLNLLAAKCFYVFVLILLSVESIPLLSGDIIINKTIRGSNNVKSTFIMDPRFEDTLQFIRTLPDDGKILVLPLTDYYMQVVGGKNGGAYEGPSIISHLTGKYSFVGYQNFGYEKMAPYAEDIMKYSREHNYERLLRIFTTLNIRYFLHEADPAVYEEGFPSEPFGYMKTSMPKTQEAYKEYLSHFPLSLIYSKGPYRIYEINKSSYNSTIFIPDGVYKGSELSFDKDKIHASFIDEYTCEKPVLNGICERYQKPDATIAFKMVNPTLYSVSVHAKKRVNSLFIVLQHTYHNGWKIKYHNNNIGDEGHILVNGYANGWVLNEHELPNQPEYTIFIQLETQKYFWYGMTISSVTLVVLVGLLIRSFILKPVFKKT